MFPLRNFRRYTVKAMKQPGYAARVLSRRFRAALYRRLGNGASSMPEAITLFLTHRCNLHCKMCGQWGDSGVTRKHNPAESGEELSLEELVKLLEQVRSFKPNITLFGGEPLLYPGCVSLIQSIKDKGMHALMITNGALLAEKAEDIVASGLDELNVSLDGYERLHDEIRGMAGVWSGIMEGLKKVRAFKASYGRRKPLLNLQCTISSFNYTELERMPEVAFAAGADTLTFHHLIFLEKEVMARQRAFDHLLGCTSEQWGGFVFNAGIDTEVLFEQIRRIKKHARGIAVDFYPDFSYRELTEYYRAGDTACKRCCKSPWVVAYVFPDGEVRPCLNFSYSFGNIKERGFKEIWNSDKALGYRRLLKKHGSFPVCKRCTELYRY